MKRSAKGRTPDEVLVNLLGAADIRINGDRPWDLQVHDERVYGRILAGGSQALGESYMDGWWDADELDAFFDKLLRGGLNRAVRDPQLLWAWICARFLNLQNPRRSRRVAERHYDLGNRFYERMLDPWMQYTCGYWKSEATLAAAQEAKMDLVCRKLQLREGDRVLELGGGWGGFARFAAERYGCHVTSYNISREQVDYARKFCHGLPVEIVHADYRTASGVYDKVVSIGICEHVGSRNYRRFLALQRRCLSDGGLMLLHTIGCNRTKRTSDPWISRYIFPGGQLPSLRQLTDAAEGILLVEDLHNFGAYYDPTLMAWFANFDRHWPEFRDHYGERFYRMWKYYLLSCAGGFRARNIQLWQLVFSKEGLPGGYASVR